MDSLISTLIVAAVIIIFVMPILAVLGSIMYLIAKVTLALV